MTGNTSGSTDPGFVARQQRTGFGQPPPTQQQTNQAYTNYGLHHYRGNVQNLGAVNKSVTSENQSKYGPLAGPILNLLNGSNEVDSKLSTEARGLKQGLDIRTAPAA